MRDNLAVASRPGAWTIARAFELFPRLRERARHLGQALSGGEQQMLAIARALVGNPSVLLMDEPFEGLAPIVVEELAAAIARLRTDDAMTMVLVEQRTDVALELAERAVVMERGRVVFDDASARLRADPDLLHALVGVGGPRVGAVVSRQGLAPAASALIRARRKRGKSSASIGSSSRSRSAHTMTWWCSGTTTTSASTVRHTSSIMASRA